jgi:ribosomal protein S18 acetylase RimI-like enzyme
MTTPATYTIRPPQSREEWNSIRQLLLEYRNEFDDKTCFTSFDDELENIERLYSDPRKYKLIAVERPGNKVVGCVGLRGISPEVAEMKRLYVIPSHRRHQLGRKLAEEIISVARKMKFKSIVLDTMHEMAAAQQLYLDLGFVVCEPHDPGDTRNVVYYEKNLEQG